MKRLGIFFFYDKDGIVDNYIDYFLKELKFNLSELCIVVNGFLNDEGKRKFENFADKLIMRKNKGLDAWAYKEAIENYGYDNLKEYDEVVLCNFTFFGPFYPFSEMFSIMDKKLCDWWGHFKWPIYDEKGVYQHIPSSFVAYRKSLLGSLAFREYWQNLAEINSYADSCLLHEQKQTPYYDSLGFKAEVFIDNEEFKSRWKEHWPLVCSDELLIGKKYPLVKRRNFFINNGHLAHPTKECNKNILDYIKNHTDYDLNLMFDNLKRTQDIDSLTKPKHSKLFKYKILSKIGFWNLKRYKDKYEKISQTEENENMYISKKEYIAEFE